MNQLFERGLLYLAKSCDKGVSCGMVGGKVERTRETYDACEMNRRI